MIVHVFYILFITLLHLSCNKSINFLILNIYFAEHNHGEKEAKIKKYQLNLDLTRSIWLEENDLKSSCLNSDFDELNQLTEDQRGYCRNQKLKEKI